MIIKPYANPIKLLQDLPRISLAEDHVFDRTCALPAIGLGPVKAAPAAIIQIRKSGEMDALVAKWFK